MTRRGATGARPPGGGDRRRRRRARVPGVSCRQSGGSGLCSPSAPAPGPLASAFPESGGASVWGAPGVRPGGTAPLPRPVASRSIPRSTFDPTARYLQQPAHQIAAPSPRPIPTPDRQRRLPPTRSTARTPPSPSAAPQVRPRRFRPLTRPSKGAAAALWERAPMLAPPARAMGAAVTNPGSARRRGGRRTGGGRPGDRPGARAPGAV
jgi:hypothetical protein